jgi:hypothetical protein
MDYALEERIGNPDLFTGRKEELAYFLKWINDIKERKSHSTAILSRRKMGKTSLIERLFNITFSKNDGVIPFYFEIKERKVWIVDFCIDFCLTFIYQYVAFKTRNADYIRWYEKGNLEKARQVVKKEGLDYLADLISGIEYAVKHDYVDILWETVRDAPKITAYSQGEFIVQMIDEFQFLNSMIYMDKKKSEEYLADDLAGGYLSTAESKVAPLLVAGSWVGWLMNLLNMMLPSRFRYVFLENMPEDEAVETVFKYSRLFETPITEETAYLIVQMTECSPFYISSIVRSAYPGKDLETIDGLTRTLEFETLDDRGIIKATWMEYVAHAFPQINDLNAKNIVLHLSKYRDREFTREEILRELKLEMSDKDLELKLKALVKSDIIMQGRTNYDYRGVKDNIFDKVFRGVYEKEIREFDVRVIKKEYTEESTALKTKYDRLLGKYNCQKGLFAEYLILDQLKFHGRAKNKLLKPVTRYLPGDFDFCDYSRVWKYYISIEYSRDISVDIFALARSGEDYSIIGEVKSRELKKFSKEEAVGFLEKFEEIKKIENLARVVGFIFSRSGFTKEAEDYCREKGIACSEDDRWLETGKLKQTIV